MLVLYLSALQTLDSSSVLSQALLNRTIPKWERRMVQINSFGRTLLRVFGSMYSYMLAHVVLF